MVVEEGGEFWSGYVAAMAGLVQSLMLLVVILACAIYLMSVLAGQRVDRAIAISMAEAVVRPAQVNGNPEAGVQILFPVDVWQVDDGSKGRIRQEVVRSGAVDQSRWLLWSPADTEDAIKRRSAYLRLVGLRGELLGLGVTGPQIEVRIVHRPNADGREVYMVPQLGGL